MDKKRVVLILIAVIVIVLGIILLSDLNSEEDKIKDFCEEDSDCVPKEQCHPSNCVLRGLEDAANSDELVACTAFCQPGTLDCGQGFCSCINQKCEAVING